MALTQQQKLDQSLNLSAAQIQAVKMLELTGLELETRIERELEENPALEEATPADESSDEGRDESPEDQDWELGDYATEDDIPEYKLREIQERQTMREEIPFASGSPSLEDSLLEQLSLVTSLDGPRLEVARYIIGNIDGDGYLTRSIEEIEDDLLFKAGLTVEASQIEELLRLIKTLDPPGVGAKDLRESLLLQLERLPDSTQRRQAQQLIGQHYEDFVGKRFDRLREALGCDEQHLAALYTYISHLNPRPAAGMGDSSIARMEQLTPDFIVTERDGELQVSLVGERDLPPLRLSPQYLAMLDEQRNAPEKGRQHRETMTFLKRKVEQARWFIDALAQRQQTLRRTMLAIVEHQREFFLTGDVNTLRPMVLRDLAEATGLDASTISRVSNSKSVQTDYGVYMLKFFFGEGVTNDEGESISTRQIRNALKALIDAEDKRHPLNDEQLTQRLAEAGYPIARRTVAKYRERLRLPVARLRREL